MRQNIDEWLSEDQQNNRDKGGMSSSSRLEELLVCFDHIIIYVLDSGHLSAGPYLPLAVSVYAASMVPSGGVEVGEVTEVGE